MARFMGFQMIDYEDVEEIDHFAIEQLHAIGSVVPPESNVWHYTNGTALIAILDSMSVYSTHISCLNDASELRYAMSLYRRAIYDLLKRRPNDGLGNDFLNFAMEYFSEGPESPHSSQYFVTCFSEEKDDLSQWRAYGGDNGYAIGFKAGNLGVWDAALTRVCYDVERQNYLAREAAETMLDYYHLGLEKHAPTDIELWQQEFIRAWDGAVTMMMAASIKHPAFSNEREVRVTKSLSLKKESTSSELRRLRFIQRNDMMSRHLPLRFGPDATFGRSYYQLPFSEIMVGPCRNPRINGESVQAMLRQKGYASIKVSHSRVPLRLI